MRLSYTVRLGLGLAMGLLIGPISGAVPAFAQDTPAPASDPAATNPSSAPVPENKPRPRFRLTVGPQYTVYRPMTARTANRFGGDWHNIGLTLGPIAAPKPGLQFRPDINFFSGKSGDNRVYLLPIEGGATQTWKMGGNSYYLGLTAGMSGVNVKAVPEKVNAGWRFAPVGTVTAGANLSRRAHVELQYYRMAPVRGFNFSGTNLTTGFRF